MKSKFFRLALVLFSVLSLGFLLAPVQSVSASSGANRDTADLIASAMATARTNENQETTEAPNSVVVASNGNTSARDTLQQFYNAARTPGSGDINICNAADVPEEIRRASGCEGENNVEITGVIINIVNGVLGILGLVAVCFIIYGGITYITSTGDAAKLKRAKDTIVYAAVGLIVSALAFAITNFVIGIIYNNNSATAAETTETDTADTEEETEETE